MLILNRCLVRMKDGWRKLFSIIFVFFLFMSGSLAAGLADGKWIALPLLVLCLVAAGEVRRILIRRSCSSSAPKNAVPHRGALLKPMTTLDLASYRYDVTLAAWDGRPFRVVHLTDLHVRFRYPFAFYEDVFRTAEAMDPDLVFITGDFVSTNASTSILRKLLKPIGRHGTYAVLGNHDYWVDEAGVRAAVEESGVVLLGRELREVSIGSASLCLSGLDAPWGSKQDTMPSPGAGIIHFVLSHNPDNIYRLSKNGVHCVFSGHFHAGQFRLPLLGSIVVPSLYGRRFDHGLFEVNGTRLFVSGGIGSASLPFRIYCEPDIFVVDISGKP